MLKAGQRKLPHFISGAKVGFNGPRILELFPVRRSGPGGLRGQFSRDGLRDLVVHVEQVHEGAIVALAPPGVVGVHVAQLEGDAKPVARPVDLPVEDEVDAEVTGGVRQSRTGGLQPHG